MPNCGQSRMAHDRGMSILPEHLVEILAVFLAAGLVKGALGLGLPTVSMGLLGLFMMPAQAAGLLFLPSLLTNVVQAVEGPGLRQLLRRLGPMLLACSISTVACSAILVFAEPQNSGLWLGTALLAYAVTGIMGFELRVSPRNEPFAGIVTGLLTGVVTGATGVFVLPAVPYLTGLGLERDRLVQAMGLTFAVSTLALGLGLWVYGAFPLQSGLHSLIAIIPAVLGVRLGGALRQRISPASFRKLLFLFLAVLGAQGIWQGVA